MVVWETVWQLLKGSNSYFRSQQFHSRVPYPENLKTRPHTNRCTDVHRSIIRNSQTVKTIQIPVDQGIEGELWNVRNTKSREIPRTQSRKQKCVEACSRGCKAKPLPQSLLLPSRSSHVLLPGITARLPATASVLLSS